MKAYDSDGMIDFEAIEREAHRLRARAAADMLLSFRGWMAQRRSHRIAGRAHAA